MKPLLLTRHLKQINTLGLWTLYVKETRRFLKVYNQTLFAPLVTALLFLAIFSLAIGDHVKKIGDVPFAQFVAAGLIIMAIVQNAFANTSSSFIMGKVIGTIIDFLMPPISAGEIVTAMVLAGITRGVLVGALVTLGVWCFIPIGVYSIVAVIFYTVAASMLLSLLGLCAGVFSDSFDSMAAITSYIITPLAFLSGTFYSVESLPRFWYLVSQANPFFYMIDGFRYGMTGHADGSLWIGAIMLILANAGMWWLVHRMLARGYRVKS